MITPIEFVASVVGRGEDGRLSVALLQALPEPLAHQRACVAILVCSEAAALALCAEIGSVASSRR